MTSSPKEHLLGIVGVLIAATLWGTTGVSATFAPAISSAAIGAAAMGIGGLLQAFLAARSIQRDSAALVRQWPCLVMGALAVAIYPVSFYASMRLAGVTIGTVVSIGSAPILSAILEMMMDGLRVSVRWVLGAVVGLVGMALLCIAETSGHGVASASSGAAAGVALGLLAGLTYAFYSWAARRMMQRGISSQASMGSIFGLGGLLLVPVLLATGAPFLDSWTNAAVGIYMAVVPMFIGYICFGYGLARIAASEATAITLFEPVVAAALAMAIVGERLPPFGWVGVALIFVCLLCITLPKGAVPWLTIRRRREVV